MKPQQIDLNAEEAAGLVARAKANALKPGDAEIIKALIDSHILLSQAVENKSVSIGRLLKMLFGAKTEKTKNILNGSATAGSEGKDTGDEGKKGDKEKKKPKGHGRKGADEYTGAEKVVLEHESLKHKDPCPECKAGKIYLMPEPGKILRITGAAPLPATVYELEKLRCNLCGSIFTAKLPSEAGDKKYDEKAAAMIACLRYGSGLPLTRLENLQANLGIPLPTSTQWDRSEDLADHIHPIYPALCRHAAQSDIVYNDDTPSKILELMKENKENEGTGKRTGMFTSGIVAEKGERKIILFMSGRNHAGENLGEVLKERNTSLDPPIQMCDALSRNYSEAFNKILANCLSHGRRKFVDVAENFPNECEYVLETLGEVYKNDALAKEEKMTPGQRLKYHQETSGPLMDELHEWMVGQIADKKIEPNSGLGAAVTYMLKHWKKLTLFLEVEKAPLDNNSCERALKKAILHRKNSLFYKTQHGAYIGDVFMSIIHTCVAAKINPFEYLCALYKNSSAVFKNPDQWLPWEYESTMASLPA